MTRAAASWTRRNGIPALVPARMPAIEMTFGILGLDGCVVVPETMTTPTTPPVSLLAFTSPRSL